MKVKICISDPKSRKTYQIEKEAPSLIGTQIDQKIDGGMVGLDGFTLQITGGSDGDGFPMRRDVQGPGRKKVLLSSGPGYVPKQYGIRKRKYVRGNQISDDIVQVNCKVVESAGDIEMMLGLKKEEPKEEEKPAEPEKKEETPVEKKE